jgi:excisionase family DNA binding protein
MDDDVWTPAEASGYLKVPIATLYQWRSRGLGPRAAKVGKHIRYRRSDVDAWLEERVSEPGSPRGAA